MLAASLRLAITCVLVLLRSAHALKDATPENVASFALSGWWEHCEREGDLDQSCAGEYSTVKPVPLDPTGNTCYVNQYADPSSTTANVVFWFGPPGSETAGTNPNYVYIYELYVDDPQTYLPTDCTPSGACSCDRLEPLRDGWTVDGSCNTRTNCAWAEAKLEEEECAVFLKIIDREDTNFVRCAIQGSLIDVENIVGASQTPSDPYGSGAMHMMSFGLLSYVVSMFFMMM